MNDLLRDLVILHRDAFTDTLASFRRGWIALIAIYAYAIAVVFISMFAAFIPVPLVAGLIRGIADAFAAGALLALVERILDKQTLRLDAIRDVLGAYFWDVISVGFVLWIPLMLVRQLAMAGGQSPAILAAITLLLAVFLNPLPEVLYQTRPGSPIECIAESARFVQQHWIEWLVPIVLAIAPFGSALVLGPPVRGGLGFESFLRAPMLLLAHAAAALGLSPGVYEWLILVGLPVVALALLLFRGHLFAALSGSSRRQRAFRRRLGR